MSILNQYLAENRNDLDDLWEYDGIYTGIVVSMNTNS